MIRPLGPDAIQSRIAALQSRMDQRFGRPMDPAPATPAVAGQGVMGFDSASNEAIGLIGPIGLGKSSGNPTPLPGVMGGTNVAPMNPFGPQATVNTVDRAPAWLHEPISAAAANADIDAALLEAVVAVKSGFDPNRVDDAGSKGLTQLDPSIALALGLKNPFDPQENLNTGARYLGQMMRQFGDPRLAVAAYNAGPGPVQRAGGVPAGRGTEQFVNEVLAQFQAIKAQ